jgi:hypothetical protein
LRRALVVSSRAAGGVFLFTLAAGALGAQDDAVLEREFRSRAEAVIAEHASRRGDGAGYNTIAAVLHRKEHAAWASQRTIELLRDPWGDMFWQFPVIAVMYSDNGQLTEEARRRIREAWRTYMPYRGDTENHWLLYYTSLYLAAQMYPNEPGTSWFTGKSSEENLRESREYLYHWMDLTVTKGQGEYDCTHYIGVYLLPLSYLAQWSHDPVMRERAVKMLDWLIADVAVELTGGSFGGSHARTDDAAVLEPGVNVAADFAWLLFGLGKPSPGYAGYAFYYAVASAYRPPAVLHAIATDRGAPYFHRERKRTRNRWRFTDVKHAPVYRSAYLSKSYAVGSDQGGELQPIQQHSWDLTWRVENPAGVNNTIFSLHPYSGLYELQMYFTMHPDYAVEAVARSKRSYDSPDKLLGGSPYEQIAQSDDTVVALYNIPDGERFPHINGFFSKDLRDVVETAARPAAGAGSIPTTGPRGTPGWIFARGGHAYIAYRPLAGYEWRTLERQAWMPPSAVGGRRLYSPHRRNGTILLAAEESEYPSYEAFQKAVEALPLEVSLDPAPRVKLRTLRGRTIESDWDEAPRVDGMPIPREGSPLFSGPFVNATPRRMTIVHGSLRYEVDLRDLEADAPR